MAQKAYSTANQVLSNGILNRHSGKLDKRLYTDRSVTEQTVAHSTDNCILNNDTLNRQWYIWQTIAY